MAQNLSAPSYRAGALICVHWLTAANALEEWPGLKTAISSCGWKPLAAAWTLESASLFQVLVTAEPFLSPSTKGTIGRDRTLAQLTSLRRSLRLFATEAHRTVLKAEVLPAYVAGPQS